MKKIIIFQLFLVLFIPIGAVVTYNINGVFYNHTTDSSGIARANINLMAG